MDTLGERVPELKGDTHMEMEYGNQKVNLFRCPFCGSTPLIHGYRNRMRQ